MRDFDFNSVEQVTMGITLPNKEKTRLHLTAPKTSLVEKFAANIDKIDDIFKSKNKFAINEIYSMLADFLSCNTEFLQFTADELKEFLLYPHVNAFMLAYTEFLAEIKSAKN